MHVHLFSYTRCTPLILARLINKSRMDYTGNASWHQLVRDVMLSENERTQTRWYNHCDAVSSIDTFLNSQSNFQNSRPYSLHGSDGCLGESNDISQLYKGANSSLHHTIRHVMYTRSNALDMRVLHHGYIVLIINIKLWIRAMCLCNLAMLRSANLLHHTFHHTTPSLYPACNHFNG